MGHPTGKNVLHVASDDDDLTKEIQDEHATHRTPSPHRAAKPTKAETNPDHNRLRKSLTSFSLLVVDRFSV